MDSARPADGSDLAERARAIELTFYEYGDRMIQTSSETELEPIWSDLQTRLTQEGLDDLENRVTTAYARKLKQYHDAGYLKDYPMLQINNE